MATQLADSAARAELRAGGVSGQLANLRQDYEGYALDYYRALQQLTDYRKKLARLAAQRAAALAAARAARAGELQLIKVRVLQSGRLGEQIRAASAALRKAGDAVQGTGDFQRPGKGPVTSGYGMRFHPILHYTKLHTGTDFGRADGTVYAADDGVVLFTVANTAYGNMTVIDHGLIDGLHVDHDVRPPGRFLVKEGDRVKKGQPIGVIGSTGYATGPHLHFEVRDAGTPWTRRRSWRRRRCRRPSRSRRAPWPPRRPGRVLSRSRARRPPRGSAGQVAVMVPAASRPSSTSPRTTR